jgi:hypothetical protein
MPSRAASIRRVVLLFTGVYWEISMWESGPANYPGAAIYSNESGYWQPVSSPRHDIFVDVYPAYRVVGELVDGFRAAGYPTSGRASAGIARDAPEFPAESGGHLDFACHGRLVRLRRPALVRPRRFRICEKPGKCVPSPASASLDFYRTARIGCLLRIASQCTLALGGLFALVGLFHWRRFFSKNRLLALLVPVSMLLLPYALTAAGKLQLGMSSAASSRSQYLPAAALGLLMAWLAGGIFGIVQRRYAKALLPLALVGILSLPLHALAEYEYLRLHNPMEGWGRQVRRFVDLAIYRHNSADVPAGMASVRPVYVPAGVTSEARNYRQTSHRFRMSRSCALRRAGYTPAVR